MSSNIRIIRICEYCNNEFTARTTSTKYCSHKCNQKHYKVKARVKKIEESNTETILKSKLLIEELNTKEFLTAKEVSILLNCSIRTIYRCIQNGSIESVNLGQRMIRVKRSTLDKLFNTL